MTISDFLVLVTIVLTLVTIAVSNNKKNLHPKRDEGCLCIKLRGTTQIAKDKMCPLPLSAR